MPRYYKDKIYDDYERSLAGKIAAAKLLEKESQDPRTFDEKKAAIEAAFRKQQISSQQNQKL